MVLRRRLNNAKCEITKLRNKKCDITSKRVLSTYQCKYPNMELTK